MSSYGELSARFCADYRTGELTYNEDVYTYNGRRCQGRVGDLATHKPKGRYLKVKLNSKHLQAHRVVYALYHKLDYDKVPCLDHINRDRYDNRIDNLRPASHSNNMANRNVFKSSKTGLKGVTLKPNGKYEAYLRHNKIRYYLGVYLTPEEAHSAYLTKAKELHGEFAYE